MAENYVSSDKEITVPFSDDEQVRDDELITEEEDNKLRLTNPEEHKRRNEKRRERANTRERERKEALAKVKELEERDAKRDRELAELRGHVTALSQRPMVQPQTDGKDDFDKRLDAIEEERSRAYAAAQADIKDGKMDPARAAHWDKVGRDLDARRTETMVERTMAKTRAQDEQNRAANEGMQFWRQRHPEVYGHSQALYWARARAMQRIAEGEADGRELVESTMEEAKVKFKLGKPTSTPTATERARFTGVPSSGGGGADGKSGGGIRMTEELKKIAEAKYSELSQKEAWNKWVQIEGKALREKRVL